MKPSTQRADDARRPGRPPRIDREQILSAALACLGPQRGAASLSLREVARSAGIATNSVYRHFDSVEDLAVALIEQAGGSLRRLLREARERIDPHRGVIRTSTELFFSQLVSDDPGLRILLREGRTGPPRLRQAVEAQLLFFERELCTDLQRLAALNGAAVHAPQIAARAITRLVFAMGARSLDEPAEQLDLAARQTAEMVRMIVAGAQQRAPQRMPRALRTRS